MLGQWVARLSTLSFFKFMLGQWVDRLSTLAFLKIYVGSTKTKPMWIV
jgi:hypothetical protein